MDAHPIGAVAPGLAAPMLAANARPAVTASVVAAAVSLAGLNPRKDSAPVGATPSRKQRGASESASGVGGHKALHAWRAKWALRDYTLYTDDSDRGVRFHVGRWGVLPEHANLDAVAALARKVGAA